MTLGFAAPLVSLPPIHKLPSHPHKTTQMRDLPAKPAVSAAAAAAAVVEAKEGGGDVVPALVGPASPFVAPQAPRSKL